MQKLIITILSLTLIIACSVEKSEAEKKLAAYNHAEGFIKKKLKSPSSAKFPSFLDKPDHVTKRSENSYYIDSWVDSQNGFGATIRMNFTCKITYSGNQVSMTDLKVKE